MNELIVAEKIAEWQRLKGLVLDSVSSPIAHRVYNMALDEFIGWYRLEPRVRVLPQMAEACGPRIPSKPRPWNSNLAGPSS
jgi:hypothetical protein